MSQSTIQSWVIGNWKMNPTWVKAQSLLNGLNQLAKQEHEIFNQCHVAVAPTMLHLLAVKQQLVDTSIQVFAQDVSRMVNTGAFTGEVSAELLAEQQIGATLIGHSERREYFAEDVATLQAKVKNALSQNLKVIYCVGESLTQREEGLAEQVVLQQICDLAPAVSNPEDWQNIIVAYEPIWAIGTGQTASAQDAQAMHLAIRQGLMQITPYAQRLPILYGGSVKAENAAEFAQCPDVNGALVGGASLDAESFFAIAKAFAHSN